jgi:hypothetical protein
LLQVRYWEKTLNLVSECLDAWFLVQRKWMYLESIFIGAEDIRQQLPEEAKKFDAIDKAFRAIMVRLASTQQVKASPQQVEATDYVWPCVIIHPAHAPSCVVLGMNHCR